MLRDAITLQIFFQKRMESLGTKLGHATLHKIASMEGEQEVMEQEVGGKQISMRLIR
jgi:hypothetical protein